MEGQKIAVEKGLLNQFKNGLEGAGSEPDNQDKTIAIKSLEQSLEWFINIADKRAKKIGLPGVEDMEHSDLAELCAIGLKDLMKEDFMKKTPLVSLGIVGGGIAYNNAMAYMQLKKNIGNAGEQPRKGEARGED